MATTIKQLLDSIYLDFLEPPDEANSAGLLTTTMNTSVTSVVYDANTFLPEEEDHVANGILLEIDREIMRATAIDTGTRTITVVRAQKGTTAATHTSGAEVRLAPNPARQTVWNAVADTISGLNGHLFTIKTKIMVTAEPVGVAPSDILQPVTFRYQPGNTADDTNPWIDGQVELLDPHPVAAGGKALQWPGLAAGQSGYLVYRGEFIRPDTDTDDTDEELEQDLGVKDQWLELVKVGAVARTLGRADLTARQIEYITERAAAEGFPVPSGERLRNAMWRWYRELLDTAKAGQTASEGGRVVVRRRPIVV